MAQVPDRFTIELPDWAHQVPGDGPWTGDEAKIALAIELSRRNIDQGEGGPFGAVLFDDADRIVAIGVNQVLPQSSSTAHAEMVVLMLAQQAAGRPRLNDDGRRYTLATSSQPCCQCYGACVWAGIDTLLIGARAEDVMALTPFDDGPLPTDWRGELERRGITVRTDIARDEACTVLAEYGRRNPPRY